MGTKLYKYRVWCGTEQKYIEYWDETEIPTHCPNNSEHSIDPTKTTVVQQEGGEFVKDVSGKLKVQQTTRKTGLVTYWTSLGDSTTNVYDYGNGDPCFIDHDLGDPMTQSAYVSFNCITNETWLHQATLLWSGCYEDKVSASIVPFVTPVVASTNTMYNLYGGYLVVPAGGNGSIAVSSDLTLPYGGLVKMPVAETGIKPVAYWNADWNSSTGKFENITMAPLGNGNYNIFAAEVPLSKYINKIILTGSDSINLLSSDASELGHGMRIKVTGITNPQQDHAWHMSAIITLHRARV